MINDLFNKIEQYKRIIIHRHTRPDLDAIGSQTGLKLAIKNRYPDKEVYAVGDGSNKYGFLLQTDEIDDSMYKDALVIIVDVAVSYMISDDRYKLAGEVFVIDHHKNSCDVTSNHIVDTTRSAAAEYIAYLLFEHGYNITSDCATALLGGIITDSGRFMYSGNMAETLRIAGILIECGADMKYIYDHIYVESLEERYMKNYFTSRVVFEDSIAYLKNDYDVFEKFPGREFNDISRGMLSLMSGIDEVKIWLNFTYDVSKNAIIGEFRSRSIDIVDIAKEFGGGGHSHACGATLKDWTVVDQIIEVFKRRAQNDR